MSELRPELKYTRTHEWIRPLPGGDVEIGLTDHAQQALGDLVFVELPEVGRALGAGESCAVVESVKSASDIYAPMAATVIAVNEQLSSEPQRVNQDPYGEGWLLRLRTGAPGPLPAAAPAFLSAEEYAAVAAADER